MINAKNVQKLQLPMMNKQYASPFGVAIAPASFANSKYKVIKQNNLIMLIVEVNFSCKSWQNICSCKSVALLRVFCFVMVFALCFLFYVFSWFIVARILNSEC